MSQHLPERHLLAAPQPRPLCPLVWLAPLPSPCQVSLSQPLLPACLQATLRETISLLLLLLLDERGLVNYEEGSTLMKAINVLMLKVRAQQQDM